MVSNTTSASWTVRCKAFDKSKPKVQILNNTSACQALYEPMALALALAGPSSLSTATMTSFSSFSSSFDNFGSPLAVCLYLHICKQCMYMHVYTHRHAFLHVCACLLLCEESRVLRPCLALGLPELLRYSQASQGGAWLCYQELRTALGPHVVSI